MSKIETFYHYSNVDEMIIEKRKYIHRLKPHGIWMTKYNEWYNFCDAVGIGCGKHKYEFTIDMTKILIIDTMEKLMDFSLKYYLPEIMNIDWYKVFEDYNGIYITNYKKIKNDLSYHSFSIDDFYSKFLWYMACDVSSCCITDISCVLSYKKLY